MVWTFLLENGGLSFDPDGQLEMLGEPDGYSEEELFQRLDIRFKTILLTDRWRPFEGFDLQTIIDSRLSNEHAGITREEILRQSAYMTIMQDPEVLEVDGIEVGLVGEVGEDDYGRHWKVTVRFSTVQDRTQLIEYKTDVFLI